MKKTLAFLLSMVMVFSLSACGGSGDKGKETAVNAAKGSVDARDYPEIEWTPTESLSVGLEGEKAASLADFEFTDEELQRLKDGGFKVGISYHQLGDQCNVVKCQAAKETLEELGIEVVSLTESKLSAEIQINDIESALALDPDALLVMPYDPDVVASTLREAVDHGVKLVFMENCASGFTAGKDYTALVSSDGYGNGVAAAHLLAKDIGYKGKVAMVYYEANYFITNERDRGFEETMKAVYPDIEIVKSPYTDENATGTNGDALMAQYPDLAGVYVSWEAPAEYIMDSAKAAGRNDLSIVTIDLGDTSAQSIAAGDLITCSATSRSYEQGQCEAYAIAYALLDKEVPSTYITPVALPVDRDHLLEGYCESYGLDKAPDWLIKAYEKR